MNPEDAKIGMRVRWNDPKGGPKDGVWRHGMTGTSARIRDLVKAGRLMDTGKRRKTQSGRPAIVWRETEW